MALFDLQSRRLLRLARGYPGEASFSPNGRLLAYDAEGPIFVHDLASGKTRPVTSNRGDNIEDSGPIWSPDGQTIVYEHGVDLRAVQIDGTNDQQLTSAGSYADGCQSFSPAGGRIAFRRDRIDSLTGTGVATVILMDADGRNQQAVASQLNP